MTNWVSSSRRPQPAFAPHRPTGAINPRSQILTIAELEEGKEPMLPLLILSPYQQAERTADKKAAEQQVRFG